MRVFYVKYEANTGRIFSSGECLREALERQHTGPHPYLITEEAHGWETNYVSNGVVVPRPVFSGFNKTTVPADGKSVTKMTGIPEGCVVRIDGVEYTVDDGEIKLTFDTPGNYIVQIDHFPYMPFKQGILAT